jgi:hypothetical protein
MKILNDVLENMSDEDKRGYILLLSGQKNIGDSIEEQNQTLEELIKRTSWTKNFLSDVGANMITNVAFLLLAKLWK